MRTRLCVRAVLVSALSVVALGHATGVAVAQPDPSPPWVPSIIDQLITQTPVLSVDPTDQGGPATQWGGFGMFCQNQGVSCR